MFSTKVMTWWDPACQDAVRVVKKAGKGSTEILMKSLRIGYCRADFLLQILQRSGIVSQSRDRRGSYRLLGERKRS